MDDASNLKIVEKASLSDISAHAGQNQYHGMDLRKELLFIVCRAKF
jgi:hypothetical protein